MDRIQRPRPAKVGRCASGRFIMMSNGRRTELVATTKQAADTEAFELMRPYSRSYRVIELPSPKPKRRRH